MCKKNVKNNKKCILNEKIRFENEKDGLNWKTQIKIQFSKNV